MTEPPKTIWAVSHMISVPDGNPYTWQGGMWDARDISAARRPVAQYTLTSHAEAEKRKAVNEALDALEAELERLMDESLVWFSDVRSEELTFEAIRKLKVPE